MNRYWCPTELSAICSKIINIVLTLSSVPKELCVRKFMEGIDSG